jgi:hypothetical protein
VATVLFQQERRGAVGLDLTVHTCWTSFQPRRAKALGYFPGPDPGYGLGAGEPLRLLGQAERLLGQSASEGLLGWVRPNEYYRLRICFSFSRSNIMILFIKI